MQLTIDFKNKITGKMAEARKNFTGSDAAFARKLNLNPSIYSRIINGDTEKVLDDTKWLQMARELGISPKDRQWNIAKTDVYCMIEDDVAFCQEYSKSKIFVDECGIGKTVAAKHLSRTRTNCFYIDSSQAKTKNLFIRLLAKSIGLDSTGKMAEVKADIKYYLLTLDKPLVIIDEAGDLDYGAMLEVKELWNATENFCGWYMIGADGLREKMSKGIRNKKVGFRELFSRFSNNYTTIVPTDSGNRQQFFNKLINDVLRMNMNIGEGDKLREIVKQCMNEKTTGGLRRAESLLILKSQD